MSTVIQAVTPASTATAIKPVAGTTNVVASGETVAVTDSSAGAAAPVTVQLPETGTVEVAAATSNANIVIDGAGTAAIAIGTAVDGAGNALSGSGAAFQIDESYQGTAVVNLQGAIVDGTKVDTSINTGTGSIADNLPGSDSNAFATAADIDFYINTGAANDQVEGSAGNDFIRLGAGNDNFNSGEGNDIVRVGIGNDAGTLGAGNDILYLTVDQLQGSNVNTITDFDANGNDKIQIDADLKDLVDIEDVGTQAIKITLSGAQTGVTAIVSEGETIDADDIEYV